MDNTNYCEDLFESIPVYRKTVLSMFLMKNVNDLLKDSGFLKSDINRLCLEFTFILIEENEDYLDYIEKEEKSIIERILDK